MQESGQSLVKIHGDKFVLERELTQIEHSLKTETCECKVEKLHSKKVEIE